LFTDARHRTRQMIVYLMQCCYALHWTDNNFKRIWSDEFVYRIRPTYIRLSNAIHSSIGQNIQESWAIAKMTARCALYMDACPENFRASLSTPTVTFPEIFNGLFSSYPMSVRAKFEVLSLTCSWDNRGYPKNWAVPGDTPTPPCLQNFNGLLLGLSLRIFRPNLKFIALSVPELIGVTQKIGQSLDTPTPSCLQNFYGPLLGVSLRMFRPNLKFIALSVPEIIDFQPKCSWSGNVTDRQTDIRHATSIPRFAL